MNLAELIADLYTNLLFVIKKIAIKNRISSSQLLCIYAIPSEGISQSELAKILCLDLSTLSRNLDKLILKKLILKKNSSLDNRKQNIFLTDDGEKLYIEILNDLNQLLNKIHDFSENSDNLDSIINSISQFNWFLFKNRYQDVSF